jgi:hypothetical protein
MSSDSQSSTAGRTAGGIAPRWSLDRRLFYTSIDGRQMFRVNLSTGNTLSIGTTRRLFEGPYATPSPIGVRGFDVLPDGGHFVIFKIPPENAIKQPSVVVVQNWTDELRRRVPSR